LNYKGKALKKFGDLQAKLSQKEEAIESWKAAIEAFNRSLAIVPHNQSIRDLCDELQEFLEQQE
jgi:predicted negative regulator of RcsB-dependent stress response